MPTGWQTADRVVLLDTAFGHGERFLAWWRAWRAHRAAACGTAGVLHVIALLPALPARDALAAAPPGAEGAESPQAPDALAELRAAWPPATPDVHRLAFDGGAVQLLLVTGPLRERLPQLSARVDAFRIDAEALAGDADPAWPLRLFKAAARLATPGAWLCLPTADERVRAALRSAGFELDLTHGVANEERARHAPRYTPRHAPGRAAPSAAGSEREVLIVGGGLAGCAAAWALAEQGWRSRVIDRHAAPAAEASGNPAGLFHGIVNPHDGAHARFNRMAALEAARAVQVALTRHGVAGSTGGLLRLETTLPDAAAMRAVLARLGLPPGYVGAVSATEASRLAGMPVTHPCWHYPGGGWVDPAGLARSFLERAGPRTRFCGGQAVAALRRQAVTGWWEALDAEGTVLATSATVVLALAGDDSRLLGDGPPQHLRRVRGQLSLGSEADLAQALPGFVLPRMPVAGSGYLLPALNGTALFGATAQPHDTDATVREADHLLNLAALGRLTALPLAGAPSALRGRTAWRSVTADRLPVIGAVVDADAGAAASAASAGPGAAVARLPGLFTFHALGSRGITWAALGGQVLAASVTGAPQPLLAPLRAALDPARLWRRQRVAAAADAAQAAWPSAGVAPS